MSANRKIIPEKATAARKDLTAFFKWVDSQSSGTRRITLQEAGLWYGDSNLKSLPVDGAMKAAAYKDLTAFFKWIDTQTSGTRVINLMKAGLWYGDAGNVSVGTVILYSVVAVAAVAMAAIGVSAAVAKIDSLVGPVAVKALSAKPAVTPAVKLVPPIPGDLVSSKDKNLLTTISDIGAKAADTKQAIDQIKTGFKATATGTTSTAAKNILNTAAQNEAYAIESEKTLLDKAALGFGNLGNLQDFPVVFFVLAGVLLFVLNKGSK